MRRTVDYVSAAVVVAVFAIALYFLMAIINQEGEPGYGIKGGDAEREPRPSSGEHAEKPI